MVDMIKRVCGIYFSPCGNVETVIHEMVEAAAKKLNVDTDYVDFTLPSERNEAYRFDEADMVFVGTPVYAGRVPNKIMPFIRDCICGDGAKAVPVVCFGNRNFDNALSELYTLLDDNGFQVVSAAAVVSEHSFSGQLAPGRPDGEDLRDIREFAVKTAEKILAEENDRLPITAVPGDPRPEKYYTPLGADGQPANFLKAVPVVDAELCTHCGNCASTCPMGSIDEENPGRMNGICIKCHACVKKCPEGARSFTDSAFVSHREMLLQNYRRRAQSVYILQEKKAGNIG